MKVGKVRAPDGKGGTLVVGWSFWCPGCSELHWFRTADTPGSRAILWEFDGNERVPTFAPSLKYVNPATGASRCRVFLKFGALDFHEDCRHELAGRRVPLPDIPAGALDRCTTISP